MDEGVGGKRGGENIKADVVIWTKNGEKTLPQCLESVEKVVFPQSRDGESRGAWMKL